jgi:hypothetical protein
MPKPSIKALTERMERARKAGPKKSSKPLESRPQALPGNGVVAVATVSSPTQDVAPPGGPSSPSPTGRVTSKEELYVRARKLQVREFVRAFLNPGPGFMSPANAYRVIRPDVKNHAQEGFKYVQEEDVREEMARQLRAIDKAADMDDQWVYDRWRAMANANVFDYGTFDPVTRTFVLDKLDPASLTPEQQMVIREIQVDPKTGVVKKIKLANLESTVANVARARQMIDGKRDTGAVDLAQRITERMNRAAKRLGRTFDGELV